MKLLKEKLGVNFRYAEPVIEQCKIRGYFSSEDMNQLLDKGFPIISMLCVNKKATANDKMIMMDTIKNGEISYEDLIISLYNY